MTLLKNITELSHEFGTENFVKAGGGNTSCKDKETIWVKPSGTTLAGMSEDSFVALDRNIVDSLFTNNIPDSADEREKMVQTIMSDSVKDNFNGRPSIEAPLHNMLNAVYVVHTHPSLVNGMTCGKNGKEKCTELFPEALWTEYFNPGFALCTGLKEELEDYTSKYGKEPELIFLKNHGVFVSSDSPNGVRKIYRDMMDTLKKYYYASGIETKEPVGISSDTESEVKIRELMGKMGTCTKTNIPFKVCYGPLSPDHIVYSKTLPYMGDLTEEGVTSFKRKNGYYPVIFVVSDAVIAIGSTQKRADNAMLLALDASFVYSLTSAFGGAEFLSREASGFIESWEAESYRAGVAEK